MKHLVLLVSVVSVVSACSKPPREAYAVGGTLGTGSVFGGGPTCTYEVTPASSAELWETRTGGTLTGPGTGKVTCDSGYSDEFDIVVSERIAIEGADKLAVGTEGRLRVSVFGSGRELKTAYQWYPDWTVPPSCASIVKTEVDTYAGADSLKGSYALEMTALAKGSCTVTASLFGHTATRTITVQ